MARFCTDVLPNVKECIASLKEKEKDSIRSAIAEEVKKLTNQQPGVMKGVAIVGMGRK